MKYKGDVYLLMLDGVGYISGCPSVTGAKTIGVAKDVEIEFQAYDDKEEKQKRRDHLKSEIERMNKELKDL